MATRSVARYQDLERAVLDALASGDRAALARLLDEGFTVRAATGPDPQARADWLQRAFGAQSASWRHRPWQVRDLAVREVDDLAIVSFLLDPGAPGSRAGALFIVDVWRQSTGTLLSRASSRAADAPPTPSRPSGRG
ncbi:MAG: nuclear transport factor 2 family protein [Burkholderiaceae bacterium]